MVRIAPRRPHYDLGHHCSRYRDAVGVLQVNGKVGVEVILGELACVVKLLCEQFELERVRVARVMVEDEREVALAGLRRAVAPVNGKQLERGRVGGSGGRSPLRCASGLLRCRQCLRCCGHVVNGAVPLGFPQRGLGPLDQGGRARCRCVNRNRGGYVLRAAKAGARTQRADVGAGTRAGLLGTQQLGVGSLDGVAGVRLAQVVRQLAAVLAPRPDRHGCVPLGLGQRGSVVAGVPQEGTACFDDEVVVGLEVLADASERRGGRGLGCGRGAACCLRYELGARPVQQRGRGALGVAGHVVDARGVLAGRVDLVAAGHLLRPQPRRGVLGGRGRPGVREDDAQAGCLLGVAVAGVQHELQPTLRPRHGNALDVGRGAGLAVVVQHHGVE